MAPIKSLCSVRKCQAHGRGGGDCGGHMQAHLQESAVHVAAAFSQKVSRHQWRNISFRVFGVVVFR